MDPPSPRQQRLAELERLAELGSGIAARQLAKAASAAAAASEAKAPAVAAQQTPTPADVEEAAASAELAQMLPIGRCGGGRYRLRGALLGGARC